MMLFLLRILFILFLGVFSYALSLDMQLSSSSMNFIVAGAGILVATLIVLFEMFSHRISLRGLSAGVFGMLLGILFAKLIMGIINLFPGYFPQSPFYQLIIIFIFVYLGLVIALKGKDEFNIVIPYVRFARQTEVEIPLILDTSVIIDGRIKDILDTGFLEGKIIVPRFILNELQALADSADSQKRMRGHRGLEILEKLKTTSNKVIVTEQDFLDVKEVDNKLIKLAQLISGRIVTNDYNLNRIAEFQDVTILNINELANAVKPSFLPGDMLRIKIVKEGKEQKQGIGYLNDGTMIVVENAIHLIGKTVDVTVTSSLQTSAGKMIFARLNHNRDV
jgi:uncharacterized protein YacL